MLATASAHAASVTSPHAPIASFAVGVADIYAEAAGFVPLLSHILSFIRVSRLQDSCCQQFDGGPQLAVSSHT